MRRDFNKIVILIVIVSAIVAILMISSSDDPEYVEAEISVIDIPFPLYENGYPNTDYISVDAQTYKVLTSMHRAISDEKIQVTYSGDEFTIMIPQGDPQLKWKVEKEIPGAEITCQSRRLPDENGIYDLEDRSPYIYTYIVEVYDHNRFDEMLFILENIDPDRNRNYYELTLEFERE